MIEVRSPGIESPGSRSILLSHQDLVGENETPVPDLAEPAADADPIAVSERSPETTRSFRDREGPAIVIAR